MVLSSSVGGVVARLRACMPPLVAKTCCKPPPAQMIACCTGDAFDGFSTFAAIRGAPSVPFGGCTHDLGLSAGQQGQPASAQYMQRAVNITGEHILVARLAAVWQIPPEILQANVRALASLLQPCGRDTSAHALWVSADLGKSLHSKVLIFANHYTVCIKGMQPQLVSI